ncbi:DNA-binding transcriptional regulator, MarR family [Klenkia marina]|uniref:DNA-binding transcriptional regulator, MarR family n=1 Tax=Klenkia marina TaxID=1960309 RepID=A0A1G4XS98_9ACTN|nr:MarR family transcriptional regulator [Klenkia marina]SCX44093.1 DNA-binding transcriptional regulator, MarR family [Klenkia marina]
MGGPGTDDVGELLLRAARSLRGRWREVLEPWDLSPHHARALLVVARSQGMRLSELAGALHIAPRSATEVVDALVERGLVERAPDPADRRAVRVQLTDEGQRVQAEVHAARRADSRALMARLPADERAELARLLRRLLADS